MVQTPLRPARARVFLALVLLLGGCGQGAGPASTSAASESAPIRVRVATLTPEPFERSVFATGELVADEQVTVATKVPGRLASIVAERGSVVRAGEVLARLEAREYELRVAQAAAALGAARAQLGLPADGASDEVVSAETALVRLAEAELARARLERQRAEALAREGVDSQAALDHAETTLRAAESRLQEAHELVATRQATLAERRAALEIARAQLAETELVAPFDGVVLARRASPGAYLAIGAGVCELVRVDPLRLVLAVGAEQAGRIAVGTPVRARLVGEAEELSGTVTRLAPALGAASRARTVEVALPNPAGRLLAGAFAEARLVVEPEARALVVPLTAVRSFAGLDKLCFVVEGVVAERRVELGARVDGRAELVTGAAAGDVIVLEPGNLVTGARVSVER